MAYSIKTLFLTQFPTIHSNLGKNAKHHDLGLQLNITVSWNIEKNESNHTLNQKNKIKISEVVIVSKYEHIIWKIMLWN